MNSNDAPERERVMSRQLGTPIPKAEMEALMGGQTAYACSDDPDRATHQARQGDVTTVDCV